MKFDSSICSIKGYLKNIAHFQVAFRFFAALAFRGGRFDLLFPAAFFLRADFFYAPAFGGFDGEHRPVAFRAFFGHGRVPGGVVAVGVSVAAVEQFAVARLALNQTTFTAFGAGHAGIFGFFQGFDVFALGIVGAADEFAETAFFIHQLAAAFGAFAPFYDGGLFGGLGGFFGGFVEVAGVVAIGVAGAGDETATFAEFDLQLVLAAFGAGFVQLFGGDFGALDAGFFLNLFVEALPEFVHHGNPLPLAAGNVVELVFKLGGEIVVHVLGEVPQN